MTESDYSTIKPVQNLPDVFRAKSAKDSDRREKKQNTRKQPEQKVEFDKDRPEEKLNNECSKNDSDEHLIDYCA